MLDQASRMYEEAIEKSDKKYIEGRTFKLHWQHLITRLGCHAIQNTAIIKGWKRKYTQKYTSDKYDCQQ
jgi:hypothetical protein